MDEPVMCLHISIVGIITQSIIHYLLLFLKVMQYFNYSLGKVICYITFQFLCKMTWIVS